MSRLMKFNSSLQVPLTQMQITAVIDRGCEFEGKMCFLWCCSNRRSF